MGDYFRSWKRKLGVVTLLIACALIDLWLNGGLHPKGHGLKFAVEPMISGVEFSIDETSRDEFSRSFYTETRFVAPYWSIVLPFLLVSAWLILSKPRLPKSAPTHV